MRVFIYCCGFFGGIGMGLIMWGFHDAVTNSFPVGLLPMPLVVGIILSMLTLGLFLFAVLGE